MFVSSAALLVRRSNAQVEVSAGGPAILVAASSVSALLFRLYATLHGRRSGDGEAIRMISARRKERTAYHADSTD
jgi:hypothetical protein